MSWSFCEGGILFCIKLIPWNILIYIYFWLTLLHSVPYFYKFYKVNLQTLILFYLIRIFNTFVNEFVLGDFLAHHKDWVTYSSLKDWPVKPSYISISNAFNQILNFPTRISDCDGQCPVSLHLFIYSFPNIFPAVDFPHWEALIMLFSQFPLTLLQTQLGKLIFLGQYFWSSKRYSVEEYM